MGCVVNVKCENCDFEKNKMYLGGSMANHDVYSGFPYFCEECKDIFVGNYKDDNLSCSVCKSKNIVLYNDKRFRIVVEEKLSFSKLANITDYLSTITELKEKYQ